MKLDDKQLYSTTEVAERFGTTVPTIIDWLKKGKLKGWVIGGRHYTDEQSIQHFIKPARK